MLLRVIHAVIFDLDGTLVHSLPGITASLNRVLKNEGLPTHDENSVRSFIGDGILQLVSRAIPRSATTDDLMRLTRQMSEDYATTWKEGTSPYPGVPQTLESLVANNTQIAVLSNKPHVFCEEMTRHFFPHIPFAAVIGQRKGIPVKPDPTVALELAKLLQTTPGDIAFVGDSTIDLRTARNSNMIPIGASWGYHDLPALEAEHPAAVIHHMNELLPTLSSLS